jgi:HEAT repeat protein
MLLLVASFRTEGDAAEWFLVGSGLVLAVTGVLMAFQRSFTPPLGPSVLISYVLAAGWLWFGLPRVEGQDWYLHLVHALLLVGPVALVASYTILQSGALLFRKSRMLAQRLRERSGWPSDLPAVKELPEVKALREALVYDAGPAIQLLSDPRPPVRMAALAALEFRKYWRDGQAEVVMGLLHKEPVPEVRAAAVTALANTHQREIVEAVAEMLRDHDAQVRKAATDALFWDVENRWTWIRYGVRRALADAALRDDGALVRDGQPLPQPAIDDLLAWATEKGLLSLRASQTLALMYARLIQDKPEEAMPKIIELVQNPHAPPLLRIEMARLLHGQRALEPKLAEELLDSGNPAPLRLIASESLMESGPQHVRAVITLRELARLSNRELSLATADVVQRCLGVDMGLALGERMPGLNSGRAIEVTRRLMTWAANPAQVENVLDEPFEPSALH